MGQVVDRRALTTFNGPLEAGLRAVVVLGAAHPRAYDLQRLIALDFLLVHTGDIGGPASLHPDAPLRAAAILVRRKLVERALHLMMTRDLVERDITEEGIRYRAGENAAPFLANLTCDYLVALKDRATWLVSELADLDDDRLRAILRQFSDEWIEEFQTIEQSLGSDS